MGILLLFINQLVYQGSGMVTRRYGKKHGSGGIFFNAVICLFSMVFFVLTDKGGLCFSKQLLAYGAVSCIMFIAGFYFMYIALQLGSYAITILLSNFSRIMAIVYGIAFLKEPANFGTYVAFALIFISVFLMNYEKKNDNQTNTVSVKWLLCVLVCIVSNGFIAILQRMQQIRFDGLCDNEFMIISLGGAFAALLVIAIIKEGSNIKSVVKYGGIYGMCAGLLNGAQNLISLAVYMYIPISLATPIRTGLSTVFSFAVSILLYKERFTLRQFAGALCGVAALLMLI